MACLAAGRQPSPRGDIRCSVRCAQLPRPHGYSDAGTALARGSRSSFFRAFKMDTSTQPQGFLVGIRQILIHGAITLLAIVIAFSLPPAARYILYVWWPRVETDTSLLLVTEIGLASALVLLFNRDKVAMARLTALVYARNARNDWLSRLRERALVRSLPAARDACVLTLTGHGTFVDERSPVREVLRSAYEIRVMLVNPVGEGVRRRVESLPPEVTVLSFHGEIEASIAYLAELRKLGKKVTLKFYD